MIIKFISRASASQNIHFNGMMYTGFSSEFWLHLVKIRQMSLGQKSPLLLRHLHVLLCIGVCFSIHYLLMVCKIKFTLGAANCTNSYTSHQVCCTLVKTLYIHECILLMRKCIMWRLS